MLEPVPESEADIGAYPREVVEQVWQLAQAVPGNDPAVWRKDEFGAWLHRQEYRNRHSEYGWEIADGGYRMCPYVTIYPDMVEIRAYV